MTSRKPLIAGNWKMHTSFAEGVTLAKSVAAASAGCDDREVLLAPPFTSIALIAESVKGSKVIVASQNIHWELKGAFTGEISPAMLKDAGGSAAIVGHSERRQIFGETDQMINQRTLGGLAADLLVILCIGETLEEREEGRTFAVLARQLQEGLASVTSAAAASKLVVAYEPVWAIGTGKTATKEQAQEAHAFVRKTLAGIFEKNVADQVRILYGGSVKPTNIDELMAQPDIDGALVGGAALDGESFGRIINFK